MLRSDLRYDKKLLSRHTTGSDTFTDTALITVSPVSYTHLCFIDQTNCDCKENNTKHNIQNSRSSIKYILQPLSSCNRIPKNQSFCDKIIHSACHCNRKPTDRKKCHCKKYFLINVSSVLYIHHKKCTHNPQHICRKIAKLLRYQIPVSYTHLISLFLADHCPYNLTLPHICSLWLS